MKKFFMVISVIAMLTLTSCATQTFQINKGNTSVAKVDKAQSFFVSGIGQSQEIDAADVCGGADKVVKVETEMTFLNGFLGGLTFGLYTPRQARVYCK